MEVNQIELFTHWDKWKGALSKAVLVAEAVGMSDSTIEKIGVRVGDFLSSKVDPENREQRLMQELWRVGDDRERMVLTRLLIKMLQADVKH